RLRRHDRVPPPRARRARRLRQRRGLSRRRLHARPRRRRDRPARGAVTIGRRDDRPRARLPSARWARAAMGPHDPIRAAAGLSAVVRHLRVPVVAAGAGLWGRDAADADGAGGERRDAARQSARRIADGPRAPVPRRGVAASAARRAVARDLAPVVLRPHRPVVRARLHRRSRWPLAEDRTMSFLRTLFLHPPSYQGFDGGAGSRYQARREVRSFWYPTWLAQPAALVPGSRLVDAPPDGLTLDDVRPLARHHELAVLHTSTPSFAQDVKVAEALKAENPTLRLGFVGAHVAVQPQQALRAS